MKKADMQAELRAAGLTVPDSWTVPELRELLKEQRGPKPENVMSKLAAMSRADLMSECIRRRIEVPAKATRGWMLLKLRDEVEEKSQPDGNTIMSEGKHKGMLWSEMRTQKPKWVEWALKTVAENPECSPNLRAFANGMTRVNQGAPVVDPPKSHARDDGPDEEDPPLVPFPKPTFPARVQVPPLRTTEAKGPKEETSSSSDGRGLKRGENSEDRMRGGPTEDALAEVQRLKEQLAKAEARIGDWNVVGQKR